MILFYFPAGSSARWRAYEKLLLSLRNLIIVPSIFCIGYSNIIDCPACFLKLVKGAGKYLGKTKFLLVCIDKIKKGFSENEQSELMKWIIVHLLYCDTRHIFLSK